MISSRRVDSPEMCTLCRDSRRARWLCGRERAGWKCCQEGRVAPPTGCASGILARRIASEREATSSSLAYAEMHLAPAISANAPDSTSAQLLPLTAAICWWSVACCCWKADQASATCADWSTQNSTMSGPGGELPLPAVPFSWSFRVRLRGLFWQSNAASVSSFPLVAPVCTCCSFETAHTLSTSRRPVKSLLVSSPNACVSIREVMPRLERPSGLLSIAHASPVGVLKRWMGAEAAAARNESAACDNESASPTPTARWAPVPASSGGVARGRELTLKLAPADPTSRAARRMSACRTSESGRGPETPSRVKRSRLRRGPFEQEPAPDAEDSAGLGASPGAREGEEAAGGCPRRVERREDSRRERRDAPLEQVTQRVQCLVRITCPMERDTSYCSH